MNELFYNKPFDDFINRILKDEHFKYSRFNDGELIAINGKSPNSANCDGHQYFPEMGVKLKEILLKYKFDETYIIESFDYWYKGQMNIKNILDNLKKENPNLTFVNTDFIRIMHETNPEKFIELLNILKTKKIVIVGPKYLMNLNKFFNFKFIEVPLKNCYLDVERIMNEMEEMIKEDSNLYFLISASMPTKIIIDKFKDDKNNTFLDWGSVWDTFFISPEFNFIRKRSSSNKSNIINNYKDFLI